MAFGHPAPMQQLCDGWVEAGPTDARVLSPFSVPAISTPSIGSFAGGLESYRRRLRGPYRHRNLWTSRAWGQRPGTRGRKGGRPFCWLVALSSSWQEGRSVARSRPDRWRIKEAPHFPHISRRNSTQCNSTEPPPADRSLPIKWNSAVTSILSYKVGRRTHKNVIPRFPGHEHCERRDTELLKNSRHNLSSKTSLKK